MSHASSLPPIPSSRDVTSDDYEPPTKPILLTASMRAMRAQNNASSKPPSSKKKAVSIPIREVPAEDEAAEHYYSILYGSWLPPKKPRTDK